MSRHGVEPCGTRPSASLLLVALVALAAVACEAVLGADFDGAHPRKQDASPDGSAGEAVTDTGGRGGGGAIAVGGNAGTAATKGDGDGDDGERGGSAGGGAAGRGGGGALGGSGGDPVTRPGGGGGAAGAASQGGQPGAAGASCSGALGWEHVARMPASGRGISTRVLAKGIGVVRNEDGSPRCPGVLINPGLVLLRECSVQADDKIAFNLQGRQGDPSDPEPVHEYALTEYQLRGGHAVLTSLQSGVDWDAHPAAPWSARALYPGERVTLITHAGDGLARAVVMTAPDAMFSGAGERAGEDAIAFGEDGKFVGFCSYHACGGLGSCVAVVDIVRNVRTLRQYQAMGGIFWGDGTGDGMADGVVINPSAVALRRSLRTVLDRNEFWTGSGFYGDRANTLADVTGDGRVDLLAIGDRVDVAVSSGYEFTRSGPWSADVSRSARIAFGDVDANGTADLVAIDRDTIDVARSDGFDFRPWETWYASLAPGLIDVGVADVTGDGFADVLIVRDDGVDALVSTGASFTPPEPWLRGWRVRAPGYFFVDVTGDGAADAVSIDVERTTVFVSQGSGFVEASKPWSSLPLGERGNYLVDVTGDRRADAIVHDHRRIVVYPSLGDDWEPPSELVVGAYYGGL